MPEFTDRKSSLISRRGFVIATTLLAGLITTGCLAQTEAKPPKILFVCQAGTAKSAIAREIFKRRAKERGIAAEVFSRGIEVEDHVSAELMKSLRADGINTAAEPATQLATSDWAEADILVNFNQLPASVKHDDVRDWSDLPSVNDDYANARAILDKRIDVLLTEIANRR